MTIKLEHVLLFRIMHLLKNYLHSLRDFKKRLITSSIVLNLCSDLNFSITTIVFSKRLIASSFELNLCSDLNFSITSKLSFDNQRSLRVNPFLTFLGVVLLYALLLCLP